jgi:ferric-dicitrate binding protein FerR (iron transport regulator)
VNRTHRAFSEITDRQWILLDRYAVGELSATEMEEFVQASTENPALLSLLEQIPQVGGTYADGWNAEEGWNALSIRMAARRSRPSARLISPDDPEPLMTTPVEAHHSSHPSVSSNHPHLKLPSASAGYNAMGARWRFVALLGVLLAAVGITWFVSTGRPNQAHASAVVPMREIVTHTGQRATMRLADGTVVTLAPQTHLGIPADFGRTSRDVYVRGEVLFDVRQQTTLPFIVHAQHAVTHVLGTQFDIRAYDDTPTVDVAVVSGKVSLGVERSTSPAVIVTAGFVGKIDTDGEARVEPANVRDYIAWADGRLVFQNAPLPDVLTEISRLYGVQFTWDGFDAERRRLTADWDNRSLTHILQALSIALHARYERQGDHVILSPQ